MKKTKAKYGIDARLALYEGVRQVYDAVAPTMGAKGRNAVYKQYGSPIVTNDGVSIAREIVPENPYEYLGAEMIKQASEQTNRQAGDGTSSTIVFGTALIEEGMKEVAEGVNPMVLKKQLEEAQETLLHVLSVKADPVEDLYDVAYISVENDKIARIVSDLVKDVGTEGSIIVEEGHGYDIETERVNGYWYDRGYVSPYMATNEKGEAVLEECAVIVTDRYMNLNKDLFEVLKQIHGAGYRSAFIVADKVEGELLQTIIANKMQGILNIVAVFRPESVEGLEDIAALTNSVAVTKDKGIKTITMEHVGKAQKVVVTQQKTIIIGTGNERVENRVKELQSQIAELSHEAYGKVETLKERLSRLTKGLTLIRVGAKTEAERVYLKLKIDDAVGACRAALEEGIVPGGGTTLRDLAKCLYGRNAGERALRAALTRPFHQIMKNAGYEQKTFWQKGYSEDKNYDVLTGNEISDLVDAGIIDPAKVVRCVIENGISTAKTLLTTDCVIAEVPDVKTP